MRVFGTDGDYDMTVREWGPAASCFPRFLVDDVTALINLAVLKDHALAGVSLGMKNWYGAVNNPNKLHGEGCNPYIPHLAAHPLVNDKLRLTIVDGSVGQCHAGPGRSPRWAWPYHGFLASTDPVAVDALGWTILGRNVRIVNHGEVDSTDETEYGMIRDGIVVIHKGATLPDGWSMVGVRL